MSSVERFIDPNSTSSRTGDTFSTSSQPPRINGEYQSVRTLRESDPKFFQNKFGSIALHTLQVEVLKEYEDRAPRRTWYETLAAYRLDSDAPDQTKYPIVHYSNALLTTPRMPNTATNRYFLNPVYEGFSSVHTSVKQKPVKYPWDLLKRAVPHSLSLREMADDELVITNHVAQTMGLGQDLDHQGIRHINKNGYSRGVQLTLVEISRAGLHGIIVDRAHGRGPGPINKVHHMKIAGNIKKEGMEELRVIRDQIRNEPLHAMNNYLNVITHRPGELMSYVGDAASLLTGEVAKAMPHINPDLRGFVDIFTNDAFGRPKDYTAHFEQFEEMMEENTYYSKLAPNYRLIHHPGAHLSGLSSAEVKFDRLEWKAEREYLDGLTDNSTSYDQ
jgi:hypothetical protein